MNPAPFLRAAPALAIAASLAAVGPNGGAYARALAYGRRIFVGHDLGAALGREVFGGVGAAAGAFGWANAAAIFLAHVMLGDFGAFALAALAAGGAIALIASTARDRVRSVMADAAGSGSGAEVAAIFGAALAFVAALGAMRVGGEGLAWLAGAAFLFASARALAADDDVRANRWIALAVGTAVFWCNLSPFGIAAPLVALADAVGVTLATGAQTPYAKRAWLLALGAGVATLLTPGFLAFPGLAFTMLGFDRDALRPLLVHPIDIDPFGYRNGIVVIAIALAALGVPRARRGFDAWALILALVLALENGALLPLFAFVAAPVLASALAEAFSARARNGANSHEASGRRAAVAPWLAGALATVAVWIVAPSRAVPAGASTVATAPLLAQTLQRDGAVHRVVCERLERCADIVALGDAHLRVLMDDRAPAFPASVRKLQTDFTSLAGAWLDPLVRGRADALVVETGAHIDVVLGLRRDWKRLGADERVTIYERTNAHASAVAAR